MHELSIANSIVDLVTQQLQEVGAVRVNAIRLRIGELSCIHRSSLQYSFQLVTEGTELSDAQLEIETVPVTIFCPSCRATKALESIQSFRCPTCQSLSADIRSGKELEIHSVEYEPALT